MHSAFDVLDTKVSNKIKNILFKHFRKNNMVVRNVQLNAGSFAVGLQHFLIVHLWWDVRFNNHFYVFNSNNELIYYTHDNYFPPRGVIRSNRVRDMFLELYEVTLLSIKAEQEYDIIADGWVTDYDDIQFDETLNRLANVPGVLRGELESLSSYYQDKSEFPDCIKIESEFLI